MFVRNNIPCPFCGKTAPFDVYMDLSDSFDNYILLVAECYECMGRREGLISYAGARGLTLAVSKTLPSRDPRSFPRRYDWRSVEFSRRRRLSVWHALDLLLEPGYVCWKVAAQESLLTLLRLMLSSAGDTTCYMTWDQDSDSLVAFS
jgi:hypothetical protein